MKHRVIECYDVESAVFKSALSYCYSDQGLEKENLLFEVMEGVRHNMESKKVIGIFGLSQEGNKFGISIFDLDADGTIKEVKYDEDGPYVESI